MATCGGLFPRREDNQSRPTSIEVQENVDLCIHSPLRLLAQCLVMQKDGITFLSSCPHRSMYAYSCQSVRMSTNSVAHLLKNVEQSSVQETNKLSNYGAENYSRGYQLWGHSIVSQHFITRALHLFLSWARPIQPTSPHSASPRSILIFSSLLRLGLPSSLFPYGVGSRPD
jgi:hypothetical protein